MSSQCLAQKGQTWFFSHLYGCIFISLPPSDFHMLLGNQWSVLHLWLVEYKSLIDSKSSQWVGGWVGLQRGTDERETHTQTRAHTHTQRQVYCPSDGSHGLGVCTSVTQTLFHTVLTPLPLSILPEQLHPPPPFTSAPSPPTAAGYLEICCCTCSRNS